MATRQMSLRRIAKELGVSHSLLVRWRQGKRSLKPDLERRYWEIIDRSGDKNGDKRSEGISTHPVRPPALQGGMFLVGHPGLEPGTSVLSGLRSNQLS